MPLDIVTFYTPPTNPPIDRPGFRPELCVQIAGQLFDSGFSYSQVRLWTGGQWNQTVKISGGDRLSPREMRLASLILRIHDTCNMLIQKRIDEELASYDAVVTHQNRRTR